MTDTKKEELTAEMQPEQTAAEEKANDTCSSTSFVEGADGAVAADTAAADEALADAPVEDAPAEDGEKTGKLDKVKGFMQRHGNIWQIVKFTLISCIAFLAEFASMYALQYGLADVCGQDFHWFVFNYNASQGGQATFIAMLGSKCIAEIISFTINRKKTFKANNNVAFSAIMYVITVVALIIFTTWLAGPIGNAMGDHNIDEGLSSTVSKMVGSIISFLVIFLMDKFVIMRRLDKGEKEVETETAEAIAADTQNGEAVMKDSDEEM